jgi:subtilisin family serine protease
VTFAAPGVGVRVADPGSGSYTVRSGTSMAAPHVAMLLASELSNPAKSAAGVLRALERSALDLGPRNYDEIFGFGLVQAVRRSP